MKFEGTDYSRRTCISITANARLALCSLGIEVQKLNLKQKFNMNKNVQVSNSAQIAQNQLLCEGLNSSAQIIFQNNKAKGFWDNERNVGELLMLVTSELGEAMEAHRKGKFANLERLEFELSPNSELPYERHLSAKFEMHVKDTFEDELADTFIRLGDLCEKMGIDINSFIEMKMNYNSMRKEKHNKNF